MNIKPQKRHKALQPLSREHHHGLLLSWKLRSGFRKNIEVERMKTYVDWFYNAHLIPHFEMEETHIFPVLGNEHELVKRALSEHRRLHRLFKTTHNEKSLHYIEEELEGHIRFEERILFPEIQKVATETKMAEIEKIHHQADFKDKLDDEFWK